MEAAEKVLEESRRRQIYGAEKCVQTLPNQPRKAENHAELPTELLFYVNKSCGRRFQRRALGFSVITG